MAISFVDSASGALSAFDLAIAKPTGTVEDDVIVATICGSSTITWTAPTGWTAIRNDGPGSSGLKLYSWVKAAGGSEPSTYTFVASTNAAATGAIAAYRGVSTTAPVDVSGGTADASAGTSTPTAPSVTTTSAGGLLLAVFGYKRAGGGATSLTPPSGMTERLDRQDGSDTALEVADKQLAAAGATGAQQATPVDAPVQGNWQSIALKVGNHPPDAPPLLTPSNAAVVDLAAAGTTFEAAFADADPGDTPSAAYFRRKLVGAASYEYYNAGTGAFQSTEVKRSGTSEEWTFGAGKWSNSASYNWSVAYEDALGVKGPYAADFTVSGSSLPSVTVTGPTGTTTDTSRPPITWSMSDPDGDPQERYHAKYFTEAAATTVGFDPETTTAAWNSTETVSESAREAAPDVDLDNATTYRGYAKVRAGGQWSGWEYSSTTISLTPPDAPTLTVVEDPADGRNVLTVTGTHDTGDFPDVTFRVEYSDDDGDTWAALRDADALEPDGDLEAVAYDYEAPLFSARTYRATTDAAV